MVSQREIDVALNVIRAFDAVGKIQAAHVVADYAEEVKNESALKTITGSRAAEWHTKLVEAEREICELRAALRKIKHFDPDKGGIMQIIAQNALDGKNGPRCPHCGAYPLVIVTRGGLMGIREPFVPVCSECGMRLTDRR